MHTSNYQKPSAAVITIAFICLAAAAVIVFIRDVFDGLANSFP